MFWSPEAASEETIQWIFERFAWLVEHVGGVAMFRETTLVLPTPDFFPVQRGTVDAMGKALFERVRALSGMADWPCLLVRMDDDDDVSAMMSKHAIPGASSSEGAAGLYENSGVVTISYSSSRVSSPEGLIAVFAHELSHYLIAGRVGSVNDLMDESADELERATDLCAIMLGFGIFTCNSTESFVGFTQGNMSGWQSSRMGYLHVREASFALAVFTELLEIPPKDVARYLKANPKAYFKKSVKLIRKQWQEELADMKTRWQL